MTQVDSSDSGVGGNTENPSLPNFRARKYCFTLNNYTQEEVDSMTQYFEKNCTYYIIGKEGDEKTPHLQMYCEFKNQRYFKSLKKLNPRMHIEKAKGSRQDNELYCMKEGNFIKTLTFKEKLKKKVLEDEYQDIIWKPWQQNIIDIIEGKPDRRKIHWFWEPTGNIGKSFLTKYIAIKYNVILVDGKKNDLFNQVLNAIENEIEPNIVILDIPRYSRDFVNYGAIEQLKNGCIYSGKYEGGQCYFPIPHVICFANSEPDRGSMSLDRWDIVRL